MQEGLSLRSLRAFPFHKGAYQLLAVGSIWKVRWTKIQATIRKTFPLPGFQQRTISFARWRTFRNCLRPELHQQIRETYPGARLVLVGVRRARKTGARDRRGLAAIDLNNHTAFHLEAVQTLIGDKEKMSLTDLVCQHNKGKARNPLCHFQISCCRCVVFKKAFRGPNHSN